MTADLDAAWTAFRSALLAAGDEALIGEATQKLWRMASALTTDDTAEAAASLARLPSNVVPFPIPNYHHEGDRDVH